ncbi:radical SAM protein, partial [Acinetobacter baumannii]
ARLARENDRIDVLMLSGGEPTLYPWLEQLLEHLVARPVVRILINSHGLRIAQDDAFVEVLKKHRQRVEIYLQYDGESAESSSFHRGADIR